MYKLFNYLLKRYHYEDLFFHGYLIIYALITLLTLLVDVVTQNYFNQLLQVIVLTVLGLLYWLMKDRSRVLFSIILAWFSSLIVFALVWETNFEHNIYYVLIFMTFHFFILLKERVLVINLILYTFAVALLLYFGNIYSSNRLFFDDSIALLIFIELGVFVLVSGVFIHYFLTYTLQKLEHSNVEKEILLQEVHHRVKNNLNMMSSILALQYDSKDTKVQELVASNRRRIESIAMVHELLYKSEDYTDIDFAVYVRKLGEHLVQACSDVPVNIYIEAHQIKLSLETMTHMGLVLQELLTNSLKYAFDERGEIWIVLKQEGERFVLEYRDNNSQKYDEVDEEGLGLELIELKVKQLDGQVELSRMYGFEYKISFYDIQKN